MSLVRVSMMMAHCCEIPRRSLREGYLIHTDTVFVDRRCLKRYQRKYVREMRRRYGKKFVTKLRVR